MSEKQRSNLSLTDAYTLFELDNKARRYAAGTHSFYRGHLSKFFAWCSEHSYTDLLDLTSTVIKTYLVYLQERGYADYTQHAQARAIRRFLRFCVEEGLISEAPKVRLPKVDQDVLPSFSLEDVKKLLAACLSLRDRTMILMLLDTGLRAREFVSLDWQHIDLKTGEIMVQRGKTGGRVVFVGNRTRKLLMRYYAERQKPTGKMPVWLSGRTGKRLTQSGLGLALKRLGQRGQVEHSHPHTYRRTFALWSLRAGMNVYALQKLMGHKDLNTLLRYLGLTKEDLQAAHEQFGAVDNMLGE